MQTLFPSYTPKKVSKTTKTKIKIIFLRRKVEVKKKKSLDLVFSNFLMRFAVFLIRGVSIMRCKESNELLCIYEKIYAEIENIKNYEIQHDKYDLTYSYRGKNGWLEKTSRSVLGKRTYSLFQLTYSITME